MSKADRLRAHVEILDLIFFKSVGNFAACAGFFSGLLVFGRKKEFSRHFWMQASLAASVGYLCYYITMMYTQCRFEKNTQFLY